MRQLDYQTGLRYLEAELLVVSPNFAAVCCVQVCWEHSNLAARLRPADGDMATEAVPPEVSPWDAPLTPSYPPALSPGTKRATGRSETGGDSYSDAPGPLLAGRWMLKRACARLRITGHQA